jgi:hypothetical protein
MLEISFTHIALHTSRSFPHDRLRARGIVVLHQIHPAAYLMPLHQRRVRQHPFITSVTKLSLL